LHATLDKQRQSGSHERLDHMAKSKITVVAQYIRTRQYPKGFVQDVYSIMSDGHILRCLSDGKASTGHRDQGKYPPEAIAYASKALELAGYQRQ
jgi:hypothetical protein